MSMSPEQKKMFNTVFGGLCIFGGIITWGLAVYFAVTPASTTTIKPSELHAVSLSDCQAYLAGLNFKVSNKMDGAVLLAQKDVEAHTVDGESDDITNDINRFTLASQICGYEIKRMCIGNCGESSNLVLELKIPK